VAVEDDPKLQELAQSRAAYQEARDVYQDAIANRVGAAWVEHARLLVETALDNFNRISDEVESA
jgi:hypothetical protein